MVMGRNLIARSAKAQESFPPHESEEMQNKAILGWVVKARPKGDDKHHLMKVISRNYSSKDTAQTFCDIAKKTGEWAEVWVSENDGYSHK